MAEEQLRNNFENISLDDDYNENENDDKFDDNTENNPPRFSHMNNIKSPLRFPGSQSTDKKYVCVV